MLLQGEILVSTFAVNVHMAPGVDDGGLQEPRQSQANQDVEDVRADGIRHRHVSVTVTELE